MKVHAAFLGVLALSAALGLVAAQDRPAREPDPAQPVGQAAAPPGRAADIRTIVGLVKDAAEAISGEFLGVLGMASELFKHKAESGDSWGASCNPKDTACNNYQYQQQMNLAGPTGR